MAKLSAEEKEYFKVGEDALEAVETLPVEREKPERQETIEPAQENPEPETENNPAPKENIETTGEATQNPKVVPLSALHEEREERKKATAELQALKKRLEELEKPKVDLPKQPSIEEDPIAVLKEIKAFKENEEKVRAQREYENSLIQIANGSEAEFIKRVPDYNDAFGYYRNTRDLELQELGVMDVVQRGTILRNEALQIIETATRNGRDPADLIYKLSQQRGYRPQVNVHEAEEPVVSAKEKLETIAKGQSTSKSLSNSSSSTKAPMSLQRLATMSPEEISEIPMDELRKLMA